MNGAIAELPANTISNPIINKTTINGASHHFFLSFRKFQRSFKNSIRVSKLDNFNCKILYLSCASF